MNTIKRSKKILNSWYSYSILNKNRKVINKVIGHKNLNILLSNEWESKKLFLLTVKNNCLNKSTGEDIEFNSYMLINERSEIIIKDIKSISKVGNNWQFYILELDINSKIWKKYTFKNTPSLYCLINGFGEIVHGPTTQKIIYNQFIDHLLIGNEDFQLHHSRDKFENPTEVIPDNTFLVKRGNKIGFLSGQAFWREKQNVWDQYSYIYWFPTSIKNVNLYNTHLTDFYIIQTDDLFSFYRVERQIIGLQNTFHNTKYVSIQTIFNRKIYNNIGFLCKTKDLRFEFVWGLNQNIDLECTDEHEATNKIFSLLIKSNILFDSIENVYPIDKISIKND